MKRSALAFPVIAVLVAVVVAVLAGPFNSQRTQAASSMAFEATFSTADDFYGRFDYGYSGLNPVADPNAITAYHGDHNSACQGPDTLRDVAFGGSATNLDYSDLFWHCSPGNDPAKGHIMTGVDTLSYNIAWFSPKPAFTKINKVCWDQNLTTMSKRKWTQVIFVTGSDLTRFPTGTTTGTDSEARGTGGYDLGFTSPEFRGGDTGPSTRIDPIDAGFSGLKVQDNGKASWFNRDTFTRQFEGTEVYSSDKATRYKHCLEQTGANVITFTQDRPGGQQVVTLPGTIPQGTTRVVFQDDNYDPVKDSQYQASVLTWHWDNIQVFTDAAETPTTTVPPTTATTTAPETTTTTTAPPETTTTTAPPPPTTTTTAPPPPTTTTTAPAPRPTTTTPSGGAPTTSTTTPAEPALPVVNIISGPDGQVTGPDIEIVFGIEDLRPTNRVQAGEVTFTCSLDGAPFEGCTSPKWYRGLAPGDHTVMIAAADGSRGLGAARVGWTVASSDPAAPADPTGPAVVSSAGGTSGGTADPAPADPTLVNGVLAYTGDHVTEITVVGLMLLVVGLMLGTVAAFARRRTHGG